MAWTRQAEGQVLCAGCGRRAGKKPGAGCTAPEHGRAYARLLEGQARAREAELIEAPDFVVRSLGGECPVCGNAEVGTLMAAHKNRDGTWALVGWVVMERALRAGAEPQAYELRCAGSHKVRRQGGRPRSRGRMYADWLKEAWGHRLLMSPGQVDEAVRMLKRQGRFEVPAGWQPEASV